MSSPTKMRTISVMIAAGATYVSQSAVFANGINPPRPGATGLVTYYCVERKSELRIPVRRARLTIDGVKEATLDVRLGSSALISVELSAIFSLTIKTGRPEADGFLSAEPLFLTFPRYLGSASVNPTKKGRSIRLLGTSPEGTRIDLPIAECKVIQRGPPIPVGRPLLLS